MTYDSVTMQEKYIIRQEASILEALNKLNLISGDAQTLFVVDSEECIRGTLTDGDLRRAFIRGVQTTDKVQEAMNETFSYIREKDADFVSRIRTLREKKLLKLIPVIDEDCKIVDILNLKKFHSNLPVDAILMAGGKGVRLRPLTETMPKPLLPVGGKAIIDYNIDRLINFGLKHISVTVNYLHEQVEEHFKEERQGIKVDCIREPQFLGTIGALKFVSTFYNDTILVMNSDLFTNIDYEDFYLHFKQNKADMSVAVIPYSVNIPYGIFELDGRKITGIKEKPTYNYYANAGIYLIKKELVGHIPHNTFFNATDLIETLIGMKKNVIRFPLTGYWIDIGKMEDYKKAQEIAKHI